MVRTFSCASQTVDKNIQLFRERLSGLGRKVVGIRDYKDVCNARQCVFYFRDREISQKTLVKAKQA